jgi:cytochrome c-type biogenesis protein CcmH/NrfG
MLLALTGRFPEAWASFRRAAQLYPLSPQVLVDGAVGPVFQGNIERVEELMQTAMELDPTHFFPVMVRGWVRLEVGRFQEAIPSARTRGSWPS